MARQKDPIRPLYPVKHEYEAAMKAFLEAATMLYNAADTAVKLAETKEAAQRGLMALKPHLEAYRLAVYGDQ